MADLRPPFWLHGLVRLDFVAAVALTVVAPLLLLLRAFRRPAQLPALLYYIRCRRNLMRPPERRTLLRRTNKLYDNDTSFAVRIAAGALRRGKARH